MFSSEARTLKDLASVTTGKILICEEIEMRTPV
jgi:hypothetical protein